MPRAAIITAADLYHKIAHSTKRNGRADADNALSQTSCKSCVSLCSNWRIRLRVAPALVLQIRRLFLNSWPWRCTNNFLRVICCPSLERLVAISRITGEPLYAYHFAFIPNVSRGDHAIEVKRLLRGLVKSGGEANKRVICRRAAGPRIHLTLFCMSQAVDLTNQALIFARSEAGEL